MADVFNFYVADNRTIQYTLPEPIMLEDYHVAEWQFRIPKVLNGIDMTDWAWWLVYINAAGIKYSVPLTLEDDEDEPETFSVASYAVDYGMTSFVGQIYFALEAISTDETESVTGEWHTRTYTTKVTDTLQGNQVEYAETEADIISNLISEVRTKVNRLVGGATPPVVSTVGEMVDTSEIYILSTDGNWYYYDGTEWASGGAYAAGITYDDDGDGNITVSYAGGQ